MFKSIAVLLLALIVGAIGYEIGVSQAVAAALPAGAAPVAYYGYPFMHFGFGFFGFLFPLLFIFLIFGLMRAAWGGGHRGYWYGNRGEYRSRLEEIHRELHGEKPTSGPSSPST